MAPADESSSSCIATIWGSLKHQNWKPCVRSTVIKKAADWGVGKAKPPSTAPDDGLADSSIGGVRHEEILGPPPNHNSI